MAQCNFALKRRLSCCSIHSSLRYRTCCRVGCAICSVAGEKVCSAQLVARRSAKQVDMVQPIRTVAAASSPDIRPFRIQSFTQPSQAAPALLHGRTLVQHVQHGRAVLSAHGVRACNLRARISSQPQRSRPADRPNPASNSSATPQREVHTRPGGVSAPGGGSRRWQRGRTRAPCAATRPSGPVRAACRSPRRRAARTPAARRPLGTCSAAAAAKSAPVGAIAAAMRRQTGALARPRGRGGGRAAPHPCCKGRCPGCGSSAAPRGAWRTARHGGCRGAQARPRGGR
jgi:hypothetical protein